MRKNPGGEEDVEDAKLVWHSPGVPDTRGFRVAGWRRPQLCAARTG
jgi:hypothetical protein